MRIGYVLEQFPKLSETFILEEMLELERQGLPLTVFALSDPKESQIHEKVALLKARVVRPHLVVPRLQDFGAITSVGIKKWLWGTRTFSWLAVEAKKRKIDHLHAHFVGDAAWIAMQASNLVEIPYSFTVHAGGIFGWPYLLGEKIRNAKFVVAISEFNKRYLGGDEKIKVVHCGIDLDRFEKCRSIGVSGDRRPLVLTVARLEEKKGHRYLLEALKILKDKGFEFQAKLVGGGLLGDELKALARRLKIEDRVRFTGSLTQNEVQKLLSQAAVFVLPCIKARDGNMDGIPVSLMEAMAAGVPVVSTRISGIPELIDDGVSGLLVAPQDPESLAAEVEKVLASDELCRRLVREARVKVEREFDVQKNARKLKELLLR
jgi:glycosyltransferase involved in cell wall biosynthesis